MADILSHPPAGLQYLEPLQVRLGRRRGASIGRTELARELLSDALPPDENQKASVSSLLEHVLLGGKDVEDPDLEAELEGVLEKKRQVLLRLLKKEFGRLD